MVYIYILCLEKKSTAACALGLLPILIGDVDVLRPNSSLSFFFFIISLYKHLFPHYDFIKD